MCNGGGISIVKGDYIINLDYYEVSSVKSIEKEFSASIWNQRKLLESNSFMEKMLSMRGFYSSIGMYVTDDLYIISASDYTTTDYEYNQIVEFNEFLQDNGINLLYVNEPTKYVDDALLSEKFGVETYSNQNMGVFLKRIQSAGINTIDLRDNIAEENITDHHWTTRAGLWAASIIAAGLNEYCGYSIDTSIYDQEKYDYTDWSKCWLGEQGRKIGKTYVGLDDYTMIKPRFDTSYTFKTNEGLCEGTFDDFINEDVYNKQSDVYENCSWHYSYLQKDCMNNNADYGKVCILGDSYERVTELFLSLGIHEVDALVLRNYDDEFSIRDFILTNGYDTVIICYAQFMLGAHDDVSPANYRMFDLK